jgi:hypothetical protein
MRYGNFAIASQQWWSRDDGRTCADPVRLYCVEE